MRSGRRRHRRRPMWSPLACLVRRRCRRAGSAVTVTRPLCVDTRTLARPGATSASSATTLMLPPRATGPQRRDTRHAEAGAEGRSYSSSQADISSSRNGSYRSSWSCVDVARHLEAVAAGEHDAGEGECGDAHGDAEAGRLLLHEAGDHLGDRQPLLGHPRPDLGVAQDVEAELRAERVELAVPVLELVPALGDLGEVDVLRPGRACRPGRGTRSRSCSLCRRFTARNRSSLWAKCL